ncbi:hypothetical protein PZH37_18245 [[Eubacterium] siraeum]|nr:hypothetical protein [[Eubacterium] siraeum]
MSNLMELEEITNKNTAIAQGRELMRLAAIANEDVKLSEIADFFTVLSNMADDIAISLERIKENAFKEA